MASRKTARAKRSAPERPSATNRKKTARGKAAATRRPAKTSGAAARQPDRRKQSRETLRLRTFEPSITVSDLDRSLRFYTDVLGFVVDQRWEQDGKLLGVMLKAGVCKLGLSQDDWAKGRDRKRGEGVRIWCTTAQDIDAFAARIQAAGGALTEGPADQEWGGRSFSVDDPDGYHLSFSRPS